MPIYKKINKDFFKMWSREMAYVLGFFAADGYMTHNKRGAHFWSIQITDGELLNKIKSVIQAEHVISIRKPPNKKHKTIYRLQIGSREMCEDLNRLGFKERKTKSLAVPNIPQKYFSDFIRGYFDGDGNVWVGYVHKDRARQLFVIRTVFTSCSGGFLKTLKVKLENLGIAGGIIRLEGNYCRLTYSVVGSLKLYKFMYNLDDKVASGLYLERKKRVFQKYETYKMRL